jgi:hypothetical protein
MKNENILSQYSRVTCNHYMKQSLRVIGYLEKKIEDSSLTASGKNKLENDLTEAKNFYKYFRNKKEELLANEKETKIIFFTKSMMEAKKILDDRDVDTNLKLVENNPKSEFDFFLEEFSSQLKKTTDKKKALPQLLDKEIVVRQVRRRDGSVTEKKVTKYYLKDNKETFKKEESKPTNSFLNLEIQRKI